MSKKTIYMIAGAVALAAIIYFVIKNRKSGEGQQSVALEDGTWTEVPPIVTPPPPVAAATTE